MLAITIRMPSDYPHTHTHPQHILIRGLEVGIWVAFGYLTQAIGLQDTQVRPMVP